MWWLLIAACVGKVDDTGAVPDTGPAVETETEPVALTVAFEPPEPTTVDDIAVVVSSGVVANVTWSLAGEVLAEGEVLAASWTAEGQEWTAAVEVDGLVFSGVVEVYNAPPDAPSVVAGPSAPVQLVDDLWCEVAAPLSDPDGDPLVAAVFWQVDGVDHTGEVGTRSLAGDLVPAGVARAGEAWACRVEVVDDDLATVSAVSEPLVVAPFDSLAVDPEVPWPVSVTPYPPVPGAEMTVTYTGPLADKAAVDLEYGFDGWVLPHVDAVSEPTEYDIVRWISTAPMTAGKGSFTVTVDVPPDARSAHFVFRVPGGATDDNAGEQYGQHLVFPYIGPYLGWSDDALPGEGLVVSYGTSRGCLGTVTWGVWPDDLARVAVGDREDWLHHVVIDGLEPGTDYAYRVYGCDGRASDPYSFRTPPAAGEPMTFLALADMQDDMPGRRWDDVAVEALATAPEAAFALVSGDMAADDLPGLWWRYFDGGRPLFAAMPTVASIGNHDTPTWDSVDDPTSFLRYFTPPTNGDGPDRYALTVGPARLLVLSTEAVGTLEPGEPQDRWVEAELLDVLDGGVPSVDWVFTAMHRPPYDAGKSFAFETPLFRPVTRHFDGIVDWCFGAHEHLGQRFLPIDYDAALSPSGLYGPTGDDGAGYFVLPPAGANTRTAVVSPLAEGGDNRALLAWPEVPAGAEDVVSEHGFVVVRLAGRTIGVETWLTGTAGAPLPAHLADEIVYTKP